MPSTAIDELMEIERPITRLFDYYFPWAYRRLPVVGGRTFVPAADVFARGDDLVIRFELPGIDPVKDVALTLTDDELTIKGERKHEKEVKEEGYYRKETFSGSFERRIPLPVGVTEKDVKATYTDGVLEVVVTRGAKPETKPKARVIEVQAPVKAK